ncbi:MAG: 30S ribosomal protein S6 [Lachnospiraceae bacterium]|nr:30S ribosomal protein S6 [Lachnospiraceae bacterium]
MNKYELALAVSGKLDSEAANAVVDKAKALIERFGGKINSVDAWGKKTFAYEVHKQRDGYYNFVKFEAEPTAPEEIEKRMRIMDNVLRYLIVSDEDEVQVGAPKEEQRYEGETATAAPAASEAPEQAESADEPEARDTAEEAPAGEAEAASETEAE